MVEQIDVTGGSRIYIGNAEQLLKEILPEKRVIVISDSNLDRTHHDLIAPYEHILIGLGEQAKSLVTLDEIYRQLIELGVDRSTFILGIGGGIVTDIAGFVASTYMRGVEFGFITSIRRAHYHHHFGWFRCLGRGRERPQRCCCSRTRRQQR